MTNFFALPAEPWKFPIRLIHVVGGYIVYLLTGLFGGMILNQKGPSIASFCWVNFFVSVFSVALLSWYNRRFLPPEVRNQVFHNTSVPPHSKEDIVAGLKTLLFALPLFMIFSYSLDLLLRSWLGIEQLPDQLAVRFIKMTMTNPVYFVVTLLSLVCLVPLIEEFLFRGLLQSWLRQRFGSRPALWITALCFTLFHYAPAQGLANILILGSLLPLAVFLSFIYEKQQSLLASITLHAAFNAINIINLYVWGES
jgi:uncharacterized protein